MQTSRRRSRIFPLRHVACVQNVCRRLAVQHSICQQRTLEICVAPPAEIDGRSAEIVRIVDLSNSSVRHFASNRLTKLVNGERRLCSHPIACLMVIHECVFLSAHIFWPPKYKEKWKMSCKRQKYRTHDWLAVHSNGNMSANDSLLLI